MYHTFAISYGRIRLGPLRQEEIECARMLRNENRTAFIDDRIITPEAQKAWFSRYLEHPSELMFSVYRGDNGQWIGTAALFDIDGEHASAECGRFIIDKTRAQEKGMGREAVEAVCRIGFETLKLDRLHLSVYEDNIPAVKTYQRTGFREYGVSQDSSGRRLLLMERRDWDGGGNNLR